MPWSVFNKHPVCHTPSQSVLPRQLYLWQRGRVYIYLGSGIGSSRRRWNVHSYWKERMGWKDREVPPQARSLCSASRFCSWLSVCSLWHPFHPFQCVTVHPGLTTRSSSLLKLCVKKRKWILDESWVFLDRKHLSVNMGGLPPSPAVLRALFGFLVLGWAFNRWNVILRAVS